MDEHKSLSVRSIESAEALERSPFVQGLLAGARGALISAPIAALIQAARGKNPLVGGLVGGAAAGILAGVAKATAQDIENQEREGMLRYHAERIKDREPFFFMPPPAKFGALFSRLHEQEMRRRA